ncbi:MAG TPA: GNAT family N-acetyltransferase [bacterium]|nr:GNAT family N-acetyltransferase [bacterium]HMW32298.1 GNAT family N-acetyltransferase [bacterium]HMW35640.1 GNAT family N-acetyltransferase [bacterium]HMY34627.1 GNAT family N-acetyltransferase [bacterium]HMZ03816.1 GNAT family N-acetyltransferase [bacterium]
MESPILTETPRLLIRPMHASDAEMFFDLFGSAETLIHFPRAYTRDEVHRLIRRQQERYTSRGYGLWTLVARDSGEIIGDCGLIPQRVDACEEVELAYHLRKKFWHQGYATEAGAAAIAWVEAHNHAASLIALIRPENVPSRHVAERLGFIKDTAIFHAGLLHDVFRRAIVPQPVSV